MAHEHRAEIALDVFADYTQFLLQDEQVRGGLEESWTEEATANRIATGKGVIAVGTTRNYFVPVVVTVRESEPQNDFTEWDHVAEASIEIPSGRVIIAGSTDTLTDAPRIAVAPGSYRARVYYGGLDTVSPNGIDGDDHYRVVLWPAEPAPPRVLKRKE